ncbi:MAG: BatD family protein [Thermoguttaceae bacterium]
MRPRIISIRIIIAALAIAWPAACRAAGEKPELIVEMDRNHIYEGESVLYGVTLKNADNPHQPDLTSFDDFSVTLLDSHPVGNSIHIEIINNVQHTEVTNGGIQYIYRLTPKISGKLSIPAPTAEINGQKIRGREMSLIVTAPQDQDIVRMEITAEPISVYPLQPFTVILSISVKELPEPYTNENPVGVQTSPPELQIPWVDDEHLPSGLQPRVNRNRWLMSLHSEYAAGFAINNYGKDVASIFFGNRQTSYMPEAQNIRLPNKSGKMTGYRRYQFKRTFIAKNVDQYTFGPVTLKGIFVDGISASGAAQSKDIYALAKALTVKIKDVPEQGRPETYIGAIGHFQFEADLAPRKARTGDPMTLTLTLSGQGSLDRATMPDLAKIPQIAENFKIYEATEQTKGDQRQFTCSLRPLEAGIKEFPPVAVSYFDVQDEKYVTLTSLPIPIEIEKADKLAGRDIVASPSGLKSADKELETRQEGIYANITDPGQLSDETIRPERWLAALGGLAGLYAAMAFIVVRLRRYSGDTVRQRRRSAPGKARRSVNEATKELSAGRVREGADRLESALVGLVADWSDTPAAGMTPAEACRKLESLGIDGDVLRRAGQFLENCESVHYGATPQAGEALRRDAKGVLEAMIHALRKKK